MTDTTTIILDEDGDARKDGTPLGAVYTSSSSEVRVWVDGDPARVPDSYVRLSEAHIAVGSVLRFEHWERSRTAPWRRKARAVVRVVTMGDGVLTCEPVADEQAAAAEGEAASRANDAGHGRTRDARPPSARALNYALALLRRTSRRDWHDADAAGPMPTEDDARRMNAGEVSDLIDALKSCR